jgi:hypothetical protein
MVVVVVSAVVGRRDAACAGRSSEGVGIGHRHAPPRVVDSGLSRTIELAGEEDLTNVVERAKVSSRRSNQQMKCREENLEDPTVHISIHSDWKYTLDHIAQE